MDTKYFGTDGIRTEANTFPMTPDMALRIGQAAGQVFRKMSPHARPTVVIGKDTRLSGYMFESALQAGFTSVGFYCLQVGPLPTPAVAMLTRSLRADLGLMITASHNPFQDNGIKLFTPDGIKLSKEKVLEIEHLIDNPSDIRLCKEDKIGRAVRLDDAVGRYIEFCKTSIPKEFGLHGMRIVVDCANGAAYRIAPKIFWELGAQVVRIGVAPDGLNINRNCGATSPEAMCRAVEQHGANLGIALDGDGDRLIMCDEHGNVIDGDQILAFVGAHMQEKNQLKGNGVVATVMSNMGLERFLEDKGMHLHRTKVGDHYVEAAMRENGYNLGGESSGHLIFQDYATTGDGILAALQVLNVLRQQGIPASKIGKSFQPWPLKMENLIVPDGAKAAKVLEKASVKKAVEKAEKILGDEGRVILRKSGTEPLIRVTVEAQAEEQMLEQLGMITQAVEAAF
ncbi:MAG: phosphoglucosamine mutase [Alphaproteobacteria bacterium]|nr:phosphoglucosamine mutase [Alphaproteobacteria bacterium]MDD9919493.1 phosphoglucosamine mutase [Alphaproteobacteria bacterium]